MRLSDRTRKWLPWLLLAIVVVATVLVYWPGMTGGWVFDDYPNIVDNAAIHITPEHSTLAAWVSAAISSPASFLHRPLASITFALNWMAGGGDPWPFKVTNIVIHLINGVLVFCMLRALLRLVALRSASGSGMTGAGAAVPDEQSPGGHSARPQGGEPGVGLSLDANPQTDSGFRPAAGPGMTSTDTGIDDAAATRLALVVSAAWMLLPINLMAVLYVVQRMESLCQVFVLAGLWAYLHGRWMMLTANDAKRDRRGFALAVSGIVFGTVLGLTSKETAVLLPVFAFLAEWIVFRFSRTDAGANGTPSASHSPLVIPGRPAGSNPESVSTPIAQRTGEPDEGQETDSGSPLRGVRNDNKSGASIRNDNESGLPIRNDNKSGAPIRNDNKSGLPIRNGNESGAPIRNDNKSEPPIRNDNESGPPIQNGHDGMHRASDSRLVIPGRPEGSNPESVSLKPAAEPAGDSDEGKATDSGSSPRDVRNDNKSGAPIRNDKKSQPSVPTGQDKRIWTLFTVTLFIPAVLGFAWLLRGALRASAWSGRDFTLAQRLLTEPRVLVDYLHWTLLPNPMVLSLYHDEIVISTGLLTPWTTLGAMVLLATLIAIAVWLRNRRPLVSLGIGWFFAAQLLTATIVPLELVYEQRMYFASIGVLMAAGALLLGLRWKIVLPILRGFIVAVALLWFAVATNLRAQEWSNPLRLAIAEANRHPASARAVYEAGRLLLIASNYQPGKALDGSWKYLRQAAAIPGSSALAEQAMIMIADHYREGADDAYWDSMVRKLRNQPTRQEDISALISLTNCYDSGICKFDVAQLQRAYEAALSRPHPIARLNGAYADFQRDILHDDKLAEVYLERAVAGAPDESAYRIDLAALYARNGETEKALEQIDALRRMNLAGRLDGQIATLERMAEQGKVTP